MEHYCKFTAPDGAIYYRAYGPLVQSKDGATRYASRQIALDAGLRRAGYSGREFWSSERLCAELARKAFKGWTWEAEPCEVADLATI